MSQVIHDPTKSKKITMYRDINQVTQATLGKSMHHLPSTSCSKKLAWLHCHSIAKASRYLLHIT